MDIHAFLLAFELGLWTAAFRCGPRSWRYGHQKAYKCYLHKGTPLYARVGVHVRLLHRLSILGRLGIYEVVWDGWQLNVINTHVPFGDTTEPFPQALSLTRVWSFELSAWSRKVLCGLSS